MCKRISIHIERERGGEKNREEKGEEWVGASKRERRGNKRREVDVEGHRGRGKGIVVKVERGDREGRGARKGERMERVREEREGGGMVVKGG